MTRRVRNTVRIIGVIVLCACGFGCASTPQRRVAGVPDDFAVDLRAALPGARYTHLTLEPGGQLSFAGGRSAMFGEGEHVATLSDAQLLRVWEIVEQYGLTSAACAPVFAKAQSRRFEVRLRAHGKTRAFTALDDRVPGVEALHDALLQIAVESRDDVPLLKR